MATNDNTRPYLKAFPDFGELGFNPADLPVPMADASFRHDTCPRFESMLTNPPLDKVALWVDYADQSKSEYGGTDHYARFLVVHGEGYGADEEEEFKTNSLEELKAYLQRLRDGKASMKSKT